MRVLYVFPHPDDESFGPSLAISAQRRAGHDVYLLTLTRGGATKQRHRLGLSVEEMGELRLSEMRSVEKVLDLAGMTVLDFPDGGLKETDTIELERAVENHVRKIRPDVLITYPVHGVSGFHDHLVCHAVVKRVFCALRADGEAPRRLAFFTLAPSPEPDPLFKLSTSTEDEIDCAFQVEDVDVEKGRESLACYESYRDTIEAADPLRRTGRTLFFEIFDETHQPPLPDLTADLD